MESSVLGIVLAGGKGTRLDPLTRERTKPAVPFGGKYRIIDFVLSNFINSGIYSVYVLTQFKSQSLLQHLSEGWQFGGLLKSQFIIPVPAQMRSPDESWYQGTVDAIYQNINLIEQFNPKLVAVFSADHIYRMNITPMIEFHEQRRAEVTMSGFPVPKEQARELGVIEAAEDGHVIAFHEKDPKAPTMLGDPESIFANMNNYIFSAPTLLRLLREDAKDQHSGHDFGKDILPKLVGKPGLFAYDFRTNRMPGEAADAKAYWRDVGTIDVYYDASMDLRSISPKLNLFNREWPLRTASYPDPPCKFAFDDEQRRGQAIDSIVSGGCILSGGMVKKSILGRGVRVHSGAIVEDSVIFDNCDIGRGAHIRRAILDKGVRVSEGVRIGVDIESDRLRPHHHVTEGGIVVVEKGAKVGSGEESKRNSP